MKSSAAIGWILLLLLLLSLISHPISAHIFPNGSSIPPCLNKTEGPWAHFHKLKGARLGQRLHGLSSLKHYFKDFGYIPDCGPLNNFTDYFDHLLRSAVATYQNNFNLHVTGVLDGPTLRQIQLPRCGVADMINGSTTMNSGKPSTSTHFHSVSHYSFFPGAPRWPANRRNLTYAFRPENQVIDEAKAVFGRAFGRWAAVAPFNFTEVEWNNSTPADIRIGFFTGDHGDGNRFDGPLGKLAHGFAPVNGAFHFDDDETWVAGDLTEAPERAFDLESVAVHEIGHILGMGHSSVEEAIIFPSIGPRTRKLDLADDDITGIQDLYDTLS